MRWRKQPNPLTCAQTSVAILADIPVAEVIELFGHNHDTQVYEVKKALDKLGIKHAKNFQPFRSKRLLPPVCLIRLHSTKVKEWSHIAVWNKGTIYDPWYGKNPKYEKDIYIKQYLEIK
jgi:hypothetical protein